MFRNSDIDPKKLPISFCGILRCKYLIAYYGYGNVNKHGTKMLVSCGPLSSVTAPGSAWELEGRIQAAM